MGLQAESYDLNNLEMINKYGHICMGFSHFFDHI